MIRTVSSEFIKLRTVVVHWVLAIIAIAFPLVITVLAAIFGDFSFTQDGPELSEEIGGLVVGTAIVSAMLLGAMGAISLTSEYGHNTIRPTFAATPSRPRVHAAKLIVNSVVIALVALVALLVTWFAAEAILAARDRTVSIGDSDVLASMASLVALAVVVSGFGFSLGLLIRNSPATVTILLLWPLIIENLVGGLLSVVGADGVVKYLPYSAGLLAVVGDDSVDSLGRPMGLVWFGAVVGVLLIGGVLLDSKRDA
jgi:ABC-2 type transport system permease protein